MFKRTHSRRATDTRAAYQAHCFVVPLLAGAGLCALALDVRAGEPAIPVYETIVKASPNAFVSAKDEAASASVVSKDRTPRSGETVEQLVAELPGVAVTRYGGVGATSTLSIRGSTPNQVQVYVDDIPMNLATGGGVDLGFLPIAGMQRLELFKGSSPIAYGSSGIGGMLAVTTETPEENSVRGAAGTGTWGARSLRVSGSYVAPRVRAFVSVATMGWRGDFDYKNDHGLRLTSDATQTLTRSNNDLSQQDALLRLVFPLTVKRTLSLVTSLNQREQGIPGYGLRRLDFTRLTLDRQTAQAVYEASDHLGDRSHLRGNLYVLRMGQAFADALGEYGVRTDTHDTHRAVGSTWRASRSFGVGFRLRGVFDARHEEFQPRDTFHNIPTGPPGTRDTAAVGLEPSYRFVRTNTEVAPSVRFEASRDVLAVRNMFTREPTATPPKTTLLPVLRISFTQAMTEHVALRANVGRYVRTPSLTERYGNTGYILPNPLLDPERGNNVDFGGRVFLQTTHLQLQSDAAFFASWVQDLIQFRQNAQGQARAYNIGAAQIRGVEAAISVTAFRRLKLFAQTTYTRAVDTTGTPSTDGKRLPLRPAQRAYARPELANLNVGAGLAFGIYGDADFTDSNYLDSANLLRNPARLLFGAGASLSHKRSGVRIVCSAHNLTNVLAYDQTGYPLPGRSVFLSLDWLTSFSDNSNPTAPEGAS